jgi:YHS domain-containing protein
MIFVDFGAQGRNTSKPTFTGDTPQLSQMVQDPVCKVYLTKKEALYLEQGGTRHYFCSQGCLEIFRNKE